MRSRSIILAIFSSNFVRWSLQFENNSDLHVIGAPTDAFWKVRRVHYLTIE